MVVTIDRRAVNEMKERILRVLGESGPWLLPLDIAREIDRRFPEKAGFLEMVLSAATVMIYNHFRREVVRREAEKELVKEGRITSVLGGYQLRAASNG